MGKQKKPELIWLMHENGVDSASIRGAKRGMKRILEIARVAGDIVVSYRGVYREDPYCIPNGELIPGRSIDWYIQEGTIYSIEPSEMLNAQRILACFGEDAPWRYSVAIVTQSIYFTDGNGQHINLEGLAFEDVGMVLTTAEHMNLFPRQRELIMMLNTMHELGHVFGIHRHCTNACVMKRAWHEGLVDILRRKPFCKRCLQRLRRCFPKRRKKLMTAKEGDPESRQDCGSFLLWSGILEPMPKYIADYDSIPIEFTDGDGCFLIDKKGKKYLDFLGGWCVSTVGWKNKDITDAIKAQADRGVYIPPIFRSPRQDRLAKKLIDAAPGNLARVFRCTSGSEAVEFALKCARATTGKPTIVSIDGVYHGHTYGAASLGDACKKSMEPCLTGFLKLPLPKTPEEGERVVDEFERLASERDDIAAFMSEPLWTNAGCYIPPEGFYEKIQAVCRKYGILLVMDEVATGMGRTGRMYASELWGLEPDMICLAKSLTGGYATMGATLVTETVFKKSRGIPDYATFGWLEQDLAATEKNVDLILEKNLPKNAEEVGAYLLELLEPLRKLRKIKDVRGKGLIFGIEFSLPIAPLMALACYRKGLLVAFATSRILFFSPPLILDKALAKQGADILKSVCGA